MKRRNQHEIDAVAAVLSEGPQSTRGLMAALDLTKAKCQGALSALHAQGLIVSEGATLNRIHRMVDGAVVLPSADSAEPAPNARGKGPRTSKGNGKRAGKGRGKTTRTRTPRTPRAPRATPAEASPAPHGLTIALDDACRVTLTRNGAAPFTLLTPDEYRRLFDFLNRMEPAWAEP